MLGNLPNDFIGDKNIYSGRAMYLSLKSVCCLHTYIIRSHTDFKRHLYLQLMVKNVHLLWDVSLSFYVSSYSTYRPYIAAVNLFGNFSDQDILIYVTNVGNCQNNYINYLMQLQFQEYVFSPVNVAMVKHMNDIHRGNYQCCKRVMMMKTEYSPPR